MIGGGGYGGWEVGMLGGAIGGTMLMKAYDWWTNRRRDSAENAANVTLVEGLTTRISSLEQRLNVVETDNAKLRTMLFDEQSRSVRLGLRVIALESEILRMGGVPPVHPPAHPPEQPPEHT